MVRLFYVEPDLYGPAFFVWGRTFMVRLFFCGAGPLWSGFFMRSRTFMVRLFYVEPDLYGPAFFLWGRTFMVRPRDVCLVLRAPAGASKPLHIVPTIHRQT